MAHVNPSTDEALSEVNVIPLADVTLVLLIILMVISPMISQALIQVQRAQATAAMTQEELPPEPETPIIVSYASTALKLNGQWMGSDVELIAKLQDILPKRRDKTVILTASPDLEHGRVVWLMDVLKRNGAESLTMVKWKDDSPGDAS